jgi:DNA invertase Pin-like site-specific DNA recombinase
VEGEPTRTEAAASAAESFRGRAPIDTTTASGELVFHLFVALAQFEWRLIRERTKAGLEVARARGRNGGRPPLPGDHPMLIAAKKMHADRTMPIPDICRTLRISRPTLYRYLARS